MMPSPGLERSAQIIAENVISALEHGAHGIGGLKSDARTAAIAELMRRLLQVMPTDQSAVLAAACNTVLEEISAAMGLTGPRVEAVYLGDGSVTMRRG